MFRNPITDSIVLLVVVLLIFGPKRLPGMGKALGEGLREFKDSIGSRDSDEEQAERPALTRASADEAAVPAAPREAAPAATSAAPGPPQEGSEPRE